MQPESLPASDSEPSKGLPAVHPPSGKFIAQLFLVPFIIVAVVVCFVIAINKWWSSTSWTPEDYLKKLDNSDPDVRWRGAETLAQNLLRNDQLASDPKFALDLCERLRQALQANAAEEKALSQQRQPQSKAQTGKESKTLEAGREYVLFLSACLGNFTVAVGAPLLTEMAVSQEGSDPKAVARQRWHAIWVLAMLGENLKRFDQLPRDRQDTVLALLEAEAAGSGERGKWAGAAADYLKGPKARSLHVLGIDQALARCARDPLASLRQNTAFALNFWEGTPEENARTETLLAELVQDDGHGEENLARFDDEQDKASDFITKVPGLKIRYNATAALARRASDKVRLGVLRDMLDEALLRQYFVVKRPDGQEVPDETAVSHTLVSALRALAELHRKKPSRDLSKLYDALDQLANNPNIALRTEAERTLIALGRK